MLDCVAQNSALLVEFEDEQTAELLVVPDIAAKPFRDLVDPLAASDTTIECTHALALRFPAGFPPHNQPLIAACLAGTTGTLYDLLGQDDELDI